MGSLTAAHTTTEPPGERRAVRSRSIPLQRWGGCSLRSLKTCWRCAQTLGHHKHLCWIPRKRWLVLGSLGHTEVLSLGYCRHCWMSWKSWDWSRGHRWTLAWPEGNGQGGESSVRLVTVGTRVLVLPGSLCDWWLVGGKSGRECREVSWQEVRCTAC